jgi:predicted Zn-dependent peptidase
LKRKITKKPLIASKGYEKFDIVSLYNRTVLENGIRVVSESVPYVRSVSLGVWVDVGSRDENETDNGITHFIEHMVFKGTRKRNAQEIAEFVEDIGGYLNAFTTKEHTCFYVRILGEWLEKGVEVLADLVQNPTFEENEIEKEKLVVYEEINDAEDDLEEYIGDLLEYQLFYPHPLGFPIIGTRETVGSFTREKLFEHLNKFYTAENIVISAAGNLRHDDLVELVLKYFRDTRVKNGAYKIREAPKISNPKKYVIEKPSSQSHICMGVLTYGAKDERRDQVLLLNTLLGDGMSSRLFQNVREKYGLVYSIYSFYSMFNDSGIFGVYFASDEKNVGRTLDIIFKEFKSIVENGISNEELKRAKAQVKSSILMGLESMSNRMQRLAQIELVYDGKYSEVEEIIERIEKVEPEDVQRLAQEILKEEKFTTVIINPSKNNLEKRHDNRSPKRN